MSRFVDDELASELSAIDAEVKARKQRGEPYAAWAYEARMAAVMRQHQRAEGA